MEMSSANWLLEMAMEDPLLNQMNTFGYSSIDDLHFQGFSPKPIIDQASDSRSSSYTKTISFATSDSFQTNSSHVVGNKRSGGPTRSPSLAQDHVIAERKRREKLSQRFIALSAIVPGLKKTDKASILGDTIKYLKQLQQRIKELEEQTTMRSVESAVYVNKSHYDETSSCDTWQSTQPLPEIEARVSDKDVLIKIHCPKRKGCALKKILGEVDKLHLNVISSSVLPFGNSIFDITIVAKMEDEICVSAKDVAINLRKALLL